MSGDVPQQTPARRGYSVFYKGKTLLSNIDPITQAERIADSIPIQERTLYVCLSPIYCYGLEKLLKRMADNAPNSAVLCIEADENLYRISQENFNTGLIDKSRLALTNLYEKSALCNFVRQNWGRRRFRRLHKVCLTGGWQLFPELYDSLTETLQKEIALDWNNALVLAKLGRLYIRNALCNLELLSRYPSLLQFYFGNAPLLVLGAGPSLDTLLNSLERHFDRKLDKSIRPFRIVCVDTCLLSLKARNIEPDLVVILESQHWNLADFIGLGNWIIPAAVDLSALPASAKLSALKPCLFFTPWTELRLFNRMNKQGLLPLVFPPLGSVGLSAVSIALRMTQGPVLTGGMDFSFTLDSYHARSSPRHLEKLCRQNRFTGLFNTAAFMGAVKLLSKNGRQTLSNPAMRSYRDMFEQEFAANTRLYDTECAGLPLGIPVLPEREYLALLESQSRHNSRPGLNAQPLTLPVPPKKQQLRDFIQSEKESLSSLKNFLSGKTPGEPRENQPKEDFSVEKLENLIDECNYLWAHFPDYAETGGQRPSAQELSAATPQAISFLKRLRAEIDPVLRIYETHLKNLSAENSFMCSDK